MATVLSYRFASTAKHTVFKRVLCFFFRQSILALFPCFFTKGKEPYMGPGGGVEGGLPPP